LKHETELSNLKRLAILEKNSLKNQMLQKVRETKLSLLAMTEDQLHTTTKRSLFGRRLNLLHSLAEPSSRMSRCPPSYSTKAKKLSVLFAKTNDSLQKTERCAVRCAEYRTRLASRPRPHPLRWSFWRKPRTCWQLALNFWVE